MSSRSSTEPVPLYYLLASRQVTRRLTASPEPARN